MYIVFTFQSGDLASLITIFNLYVCDTEKHGLSFRFVIKTWRSVYHHIQIDNIMFAFALLFYITVQFNRYFTAECQCDAPVLEFTCKGKQNVIILS